MKNNDKNTMDLKPTMMVKLFIGFCLVSLALIVLANVA